MFGYKMTNEVRNFICLTFLQPEIECLHFFVSKNFKKVSEGNGFIVVYFQFFQHSIFLLAFFKQKNNAEKIEKKILQKKKVRNVKSWAIWKWIDELIEPKTEFLAFFQKKQPELHNFIDILSNWGVPTVYQNFPPQNRVILKITIHVFLYMLTSMVRGSKKKC